MNKADWRPIGGADFAQLSQARIAAHYAAQWLAQAARAFIPARPDDSHTNLGWDEALGGLVTHKLQGARLGLQLPEFALALLEGDGGTPAQIFPLDGLADKDARAWLGQEMHALGLDAKKLDAPSPYEMPAHAIAKGATYAAAKLTGALAELAAWFANADISLGRLGQAYAANKLQVSPLRCWPHHFDLAILITLDAVGGEHARSVNAGLSPGDGSYDEPYFYVSPYPYPDAAKLPKLPKLGHWHTKGFTAAIAPASRIIAAKDRQGETEAFLSEAIEGAVKFLR